jgi:opacity protein-like surface antigen
MKTFLIACVMLAVIPSMAIARDALAGSWNATVTPAEDAAQAHQKEFKDVLTFKGNTFASEDSKKRGFGAMTYEENQQYGLASTFEAKGKNEKTGESITWTGQASANQLKGEMVIKKSDGSELHFNYQAEKKQ